MSGRSVSQQWAGVKGSGGSRRTVFRALVVLALVAAGTVAKAGAASADVAAITVTPSTGLVNGQVVTVAGTGWLPSSVVGVCEADPVAGGGVDDCADGDFVEVTTDTIGSFSTPITLKRDFAVAATGGRIDCADPSVQCIIGAAQADDVADTAIGFTITFAPGQPEIVPGNISVGEGNSGTSEMDLPVTLSFASTDTVTAHWATATAPDTAFGHADPATDFTAASGTVTFAPGVTTATVPISINGDTLVEPNENLPVVFSNPTNATIGGLFGIGVGVIVNDDSALIQPGFASVQEGNSGTTNLVVPVTLLNPSSAPITVQWKTGTVTPTSPHLADPATDFTAASGTITFAPGQTAQSITLTINGDTTVEMDEYIIIAFGHANAPLAGHIYHLGFGEILNDD